MVEFKMFHNGFCIHSGVSQDDYPRELITNFLNSISDGLSGKISVVYRTTQDVGLGPWRLADFDVKFIQKRELVCKTIYGCENVTIEQLDNHELFMVIGESTIHVKFNYGDLSKFLILMDQKGLLPTISCGFKTGAIADHTFVFECHVRNVYEISDR